ncbi:MAG: phenylalanine 4-monooxygenase [Proteobacteria bacterium]|nr:phenylalanine 4-monooxygenase [Pseudomonadota bacterium]MCP4921439.1 phenylalanine 4-monooxygenase [Pseudomonadota bacterium]
MHAGGPDNLVELDPDHPGFRDATYRVRRDTIARIALEYASGSPVPSAPYSAEEHGVWATIRAGLDGLHDEHVHSELNALRHQLGLPTDRIPQLAEVNASLQAATGFRMEPVAGLVRARVFLSHLGRGVFLSTQYIRHHSRPFYTPEPDVVHELVGHAATLVHPELAALNRRVGRLADRVDDATMTRIERVYWYTLEFGLVREDGELRGLGAGVLSSVGELRRAVGLEPGVELVDWDLDRMAATPYDPTDFQPALFVAPSWSRMFTDLSDWLTTLERACSTTSSTSA